MEKLVFIVDDDIVQNEIHSILLKKVDPGTIVKSFVTAQKAIDAIDSGHMPDVIFLDLHIPGESETRFLEEHKSRDLDGDIYLMSSMAYFNDPKLMTNYPAIKDFITKPLLDHKLRSVLKHHA